MPTSSPPSSLLQNLHQEDFEIKSLDDEIRVDGLCVELLQRLCRELIEQQGLSPADAGEICHGADYFLREFIIADCNENILTIHPERIRQFGGHWYIIRTIEPNLSELRSILNGTALFYQKLARQGVIDHDLAKIIQSHCHDLDFYTRRIEDFWAIEGGGFDAWRAACPLENRKNLS